MIFLIFFLIVENLLEEEVVFILIYQEQHSVWMIKVYSKHPFSELLAMSL